MSLPVARVELVDDLPGDLPLLVLQRDGEIVVQVVRGEMSERCAAAWAHMLQHAFANGIWEQHWPELRPTDEHTRVDQHI
jgi:hypothetical protein